MFPILDLSLFSKYMKKKMSLLYFILKGQKNILGKNIIVFYESRVGLVLGFRNWDMKQRRSSEKTMRR